ncbi:MAG TPA: helix-turn-helix domain-containing protein [Myxococcota bacterium]|nr:helix-turn-helix domain-containing protein [Myxococcota bacterium]HRY93593.1 helix-turn-helix domain-containing protein [Myxococcota bacterium]
MTGKEIAAIRNGLEMTQTHLGQLLGVHPLTVSKWERGHLTPTPHQEALLDSFRKAMKRQSNIGKIAIGLLVGAGVGIALYFLLKAAFSEDKQ